MIPRWQESSSSSSSSATWNTPDAWNREDDTSWESARKWNVDATWTAKQWKLPQIDEEVSAATGKGAHAGKTWRPKKQDDKEEK